MNELMKLTCEKQDDRASSDTDCPIPRTSFPQDELLATDELGLKTQAAGPYEAHEKGDKGTGP